MLHIWLIGRVCIRRADHCSANVSSVHNQDTCEADNVKLGHFSQGLIAYLVLNRRRPYTRDSLSDVFWGNQSTEQAKACLSTAIWRLRRVLEPTPVPRGTYLQADTTGDISLNAKNIAWLDVADLEATLQPILTGPVHDLRQADIDRAEQVISQTEGTLLEDFFDEWVVAERERLRCLKLNGMARVMVYCREHGLTERAITQAQNILHEDPLREDIHRELMRLYCDAGQRALAAKQYEICKTVLQRELDIPPMLETQQAMADLTADQPNPTNDRHASSRLAKPARSAWPTRLDEALTALQAAQTQLQQALYCLSQVASLGE